MEAGVEEGAECRCCLEGAGVWTGADGVRLADLLLACAGLRMDESERMPRAVCERCRGSLLQFHAFRSRCREVDLILREKYLSLRPASDHDYEVPLLVEVTEEAGEGAGAGGRPRASRVRRGKRGKKAKSNLRKIHRKQLVRFVGKSKKSASVTGQLPAVKEECEAPSKQDGDESERTTVTPDEGEARARPRRERRPNAHVCERCGYAAADRCSLRVHARFHTGERPFACLHCGKAFAISANLKAHLRTHSGERPFVCEACGRALSTAAALRGHARTHTGERPFACAACPSAFALRSNLRQHERTHTGVKPYVCDICARRFSSSSDARAHRRTHTGERPHACAEPGCGKRFALASNLRAHRRTHERSHACASCELQFSCRSALTAHARAHRERAPPPAGDATPPGGGAGDARRHACGVCGKRFARKSSLVVHRRRQHTAGEVSIASEQLVELGEVAAEGQGGACLRRPLGEQQIVTDASADVDGRREALTFVQIQRATGVQVRVCAGGRTSVAAVLPLALLPLSVLR